MDKILCILLISILVTSANSSTVYVKPGDNFQEIIDSAENNDTLIIAKHSFEAKKTAYIDPLCGNCLEAKTEVSASYGFLLRGKSLVIIGEDKDSSILITNAGYGFFIDNSPNLIIRNITITGGKRDLDGNATDAAIVVRNSKVLIENVLIKDNDHREDSVVVGIGGIFGREKAELYIHNCQIINGGWDGIALYRGATATITDCLIKDGRGAGIGVTWDATCIALRNEITGFWKGIGAFGTTWVICNNNLVHNNLGWGIIATGNSFMDISNNVVNNNGNCGIAPWSMECKGRIVNNIVTNNGWRKEWVCPCVGIWNNGNWENWQFAFNIVWNNKEGEYREIDDQSGVNGNLNLDPLYSDSIYFNLLENSPALNSGDSSLYNKDGSRSHIGITGGAHAR